MSQNEIKKELKYFERLIFENENFSVAQFTFSTFGEAEFVHSRNFQLRGKNSQSNVNFTMYDLVDIVLSSPRMEADFFDVLGYRKAIKETEREKRERENKA